MNFRHILPNKTPEHMALTVLNSDGRPSRTVWKPFWAFQIFGGHTWSLSLIKLGRTEVRHD